MNKLYSVHDHWTDINKKNDVDIESIDGVITGIKVNGEDYGGGTSWFNVYSDTVDPSGELAPFVVNIPLTLTTSDTIKVIYDNTEYILPKQVFNEKIYYGATPGSLPTDIDFSDCPFLIQVLQDSLTLFTETAGLHTLNISVPQSGGGGSDFSTATVNITYNGPGNDIYAKVAFVDDNIIKSGDFIEHGTPKILTVPIASGGAIIDFDELSSQSYVISGDVKSIDTPNLSPFLITGDCTITIS